MEAHTRGGKDIKAHNRRWPLHHAILNQSLASQRTTSTQPAASRNTTCAQSTTGQTITPSLPTTSQGTHPLQPIPSQTINRRETSANCNAQPIVGGSNGVSVENSAAASRTFVSRPKRKRESAHGYDACRPLYGPRSTYGLILARVAENTARKERKRLRRS